MASTIENFIVKITTQGAEKLDQIARGADALNSKMNALSGALLGVGFGAFIRGALESADRMVDLSDATGLTVGSIKAFGESMRLAGGSSKNAEKAIMALYGAIEAAADGGLRQQEAFKKVKVTLNDLRNLSEADILQKTIEGLAEIPAGSERAAAATALLGRSFRGIEAKKFLDTLDPQKYAEYEAAAKKAADTVERFENIYTTLQQGALQAFEPLLKYLEDINLTAKDAERLFTILAGVIGALFGASMLLKIVKFNEALGITAAIANIIGKSPVGLIAKLLAAGATTAAAAATVVALEKLMSANNDVAESAKVAGEAQKKIIPTNPQEGPAKRRVIEAKTPEQKALEESQKRIAQIQEETERLRKSRLIQGIDDIAQLEINGAADIAKARQEIFAKENLSKEQMNIEFEAKRKELTLKTENEIAKLRADAARQGVEQLGNIGLQTRELGWQLNLEKEMIGLSQTQRSVRQATFDIEKQRMAALEQMYRIQNMDPQQREFFIKQINAMYDAQARFKAQTIEVQNSFEAGWARAFSSYMDNATNAAKMAENTFNAMTSNLNRAIDDFVDNGKFSFRDFTNSVLRDMAKIQMKAAAANILSAGGSLLSGLFSGRAIGGPVQANEPYVVGERGPELFVPATAGNIVPNNNMSSGTGGSTIVQYNISAVDALSFKQMIARDPTFLYAVAEQGRKSLPLTRR